MGPLLKFTDKLYDIFDDIRDPVSNRLIEIEMDSTVFNMLGITSVDVSDEDWCFNVTTENKEGSVPMKIGRFMRYFLAGEFSEKQVYDFSKNYNRIKSELGSKEGIKYIEVPKFVFSPKDIRRTFLSLVTKTYPHGTENGVIPFLTPGLKVDKFGNLYRIIGRSSTMFTSHIDTADRTQSSVNLIEKEENGEVFILTDGKTILGADDKAGVAVMMYMMAHNIPGLYYFFLGEERGGIGSNKLASEYDSFSYLKDIKRCISFDRRNYYSVITKQLGRVCCSDEFARSLAKELNKSGLELDIDPTGIYTDSASFMDEIPECTNISVGYFNEHTGKEFLNLTYLERLAKACIKANWDSLPTVRKVGFAEELKSKYKNLIKDLKGLTKTFYSEVSLFSEEGRAFIKIDIDHQSVEGMQRDIFAMSKILNTHKLNPDIYFGDDVIKIELK